MQCHRIYFLLFGLLDMYKCTVCYFRNASDPLQVKISQIELMRVEDGWMGG